MRYSQAIAAGCTLLAAISSCSGGHTGSQSYTRRLIDPDGVPAIQNGALPAEWDGGLPRLTLEETARIGRAEGPDEQLISSRWTGMAVAPDGSVGYLERSPTELRVYGPEGRFRFRAGQGGDGPGEWRYANVLEHVPGLGWAVSAGRSRFVLWGEDGGLLDTIGLQDLPGQILNWMAVGADGALWYYAEQPVTWGDRTASLIRADWRTLEADTVLTVLRHRQERVKDYGLMYTFPQSMGLGPDGRLWTNTSLDYVIEVYGRGEEHVRVRRAYDPVPDPLHGKEPEDPDSYSMMQDYRPIYSGHHASQPAIRSLRWVDGKELWVFTAAPADSGHVQVDVFDPEGRYVRAFSAPADLAHARMGIAAGHIWWLSVDEEETPVLVRYRYGFDPVGDPTRPDTG